MDRKLLLLCVLGGCLVAQGLAMKHSRSHSRTKMTGSRKTRMPPPPKPGMMPPPPPSMPGMRPPPPVSENFTHCDMQKEEFPHIRCESNGNFSDVQCTGHGPGRQCFCVHPETGDRLNSQTFPERERDTVNCSNAFQCPESTCATICSHGYVEDQNGCQTCRCNASPEQTRCPTVTELVGGGCPCGCVDTPREEKTPRRSRSKSSCPVCRDNCSATLEQNTTCPVVLSCGTDEGVLVSVGPNGINQCREPLSDGSTCGSGLAQAGPSRAPPPSPGPHSSRSRKPTPVGSKDREALSNLGEVEPPCGDGSVCKQTGLMEMQCQPEPQGPCVQARDDPESPEPTIQCNEDGEYDPLQCHPVNPKGRGTHGSRGSHSPRAPPHDRCHCVMPDNGTVIDGTEVTVRPGNQKPNCNRIVYRHCEVPGITKGPRHFHVHHGESYFDAENCRTCECKDGNATAFCSEPGNCTVTVVTSDPPKNCSLPGGDVLPHDMTMETGCGACGCRDGRLRCTHPHNCHTDEEGIQEEEGEEEEEEEDACRMCRKDSFATVCGPDGHNYPSRCAAVNCAGFSPVVLENGPCQSQDVCEKYPCEEGRVCVRAGGVACMGKVCQPEHYRTCVDLEKLECPAANETNLEAVPTPTGQEVCGTDNQTYSSICNLLQTSRNVEVAHVGSCVDEKCQSGPMCGADGLTYDNICVLQSLAVTRLDFEGECGNFNGEPWEDHCETVRNTGHCLHNSTNCRHLVETEDGCCPICGGSVILAVDREALQEVSESNPRVATVDGFTGEMTDFTLIFETVEQSCTIEPSLTETGNLQIAIVAKGDNNSEFCHEKAHEIAEIVNNGTNSIVPSSGGPSSDPIILPQVFDFAMAASAAPRLLSKEEEEQEEGEEEENGARGLFLLYSLPLFICPVIGFARL